MPAPPLGGAASPVRLERLYPGISGGIGEGPAQPDAGQGIPEEAVDA